MAGGQQGEQHLLEYRLLADEGMRHLGTQRAGALAQLGDHLGAGGVAGAVRISGVMDDS